MSYEITKVAETLPLSELLDGYQLEILEQAALLCERIRDTKTQLGLKDEAKGAEACRAAIQKTADLIRMKPRAENTDG